MKSKAKPNPPTRLGISVGSLKKIIVIRAPERMGTFSNWDSTSPMIRNTLGFFLLGLVEVVFIFSPGMLTVNLLGGGEQVSGKGCLNRYELLLRTELSISWSFSSLRLFSWEYLRSLFDISQKRSSSRNQRCWKETAKLALTWPPYPGSQC